MLICSAKTVIACQVHGNITKVAVTITCVFINMVI